MSETNDLAPPRVKGFPWRTLAVVSLMINLLIVGSAIGFVASGGFARRMAMGMEQQRPGAMLRGLPPEERRVLVRDLVSAWRDTGEQRQAAMSARAAMMDVARAEPYDEQKMREALAAMRGADQAVVGRYHETLLKTLGNLTAAQRVAALRAAGARPGMRGGEGRGGPGGPGRDGPPRDGPRP